MKSEMSDLHDCTKESTNILTEKKRDSKITCAEPHQPLTILQDNHDSYVKNAMKKKKKYVWLTDIKLYRCFIRVGLFGKLIFTLQIHTSTSIIYLNNKYAWYRIILSRI